MSGDSSIFVAYSRRSVWLILSWIALSGVLAATVLVRISVDQDREAAATNRHVISVMLDQQRKAFSRVLLDYADWGAAYEHLHEHVDIQWAYEQNNLGPDAATNLGVEYVAVFDPAGQQVYVVVDGKIADQLPSISGGLPDFIARARASPTREVTNAILTVDGEPLYAAAAIISTGGDAVAARPGPPSVLFFAHRYSTSVLNELRGLLNLETLSLPVTRVGSADEFLRTSDGSVAFALAASAPTPGRDMLVALLPLLSAALLALGLFLCALAKKGLEIAELAKQASKALTESQMQLQQQVHQDFVTGLPNRAMFLKRLKETLNSDTPSHVLFLDLDKFKPVNDCLGHAAGDAALEEVGKRLRDGLMSSDLAARLGGDEFAIIATNRSERSLKDLCETLIQRISEPMTFNDQSFTIGVSIGVANVNRRRTVEEVLQKADEQLYQAKSAGRMTFRCEPAIATLAVA
jgi:diguanylate cyclase (GGDEF)-like protein